MTEIKQPKIRFKGHINDWEECKLKNVSAFKQGIQVDLERQYQIQNDNLIRFIRIVDYTQNTQDIRYIDINTSKNITQPDDIIMVRYGASAGFIGRGIEGILANNMFSINPTQKIVKDYLYIYLRQDKIYKQLNNSNGSSAMPAINFSLVGNLNITYPKLEEQTKIGEFFKTLDDTIALHQQKLEVTKQFKQTMLKKMFPKNGETTPEIRFKGFTDDWGECKLGDVIEEYSELQAQSIEYPLVSFTSENGVTPKTERYNREQLVVGEASSKKYKKTEYNDIVYNPANLKFGAIARNTYGKSVFSPIYVTFKVISNNVSPEFIESIVTREDFIKYSLKFEEGTVYERKSVKPKDFLNINCRIPSSKEQYMIGKYFEELENKINDLEQKLKILKEMKKTMLRKMFV